MSPEKRRARAFARRVIRELVDVEGKYVPDAAYEIQGNKLVEYLAFAYEAAQAGGRFQFQNGRAIILRKAVPR